MLVDNLWISLQARTPFSLSKDHGSRFFCKKIQIGGRRSAFIYAARLHKNSQKPYFVVQFAYFCNKNLMFLFNFRDNINITFRNKEQLSTFLGQFWAFFDKSRETFFKALITAHEREEFLQITRNRKNTLCPAGSHWVVKSVCVQWNESNSNNEMVVDFCQCSRREINTLLLWLQTGFHSFNYTRNRITKPSKLNLGTQI